MQIKTTMRYHLTPVRMPITYKSTNNKFGEVVEKRNHHSLLVGMQTGAATEESGKEGPQESKM